jgi:Protein of unknown function (DUF2845)
MQTTHSQLIRALTFSISLTAVILGSSLSTGAGAESMRCNGSLVGVGDTKATVVSKCGNPEMTDSFCEKKLQEIIQPDGTYAVTESCEDVEVWTYQRGRGKFSTDLYFSQGKIREMRYGDRS